MSLSICGEWFKDFLITYLKIPRQVSGYLQKSIETKTDLIE